MREIEVVSKNAKGEVIGTGKCKQYDSLAEADKDLGKDVDGSSRALNILNAALVIRAQQKLRRKTTPSLVKALKNASPEVKARIEKFLQEMGLGA